MSDPLRADPANDHSTASQGDADRDAKIESLLLSGLDHYFSSDYAQAIDIWTRALFLDRQHARARAYIERARSALAEQQRESDELLHNGVAAFERGEIEAARQLLNAAVQRGGAHDVALAFLTRIDRISAAAPAAQSPTSAPARVQFRPTTVVVQPHRSPWIAAIIAVAVLATGGLAVTSWDRVRESMPFLSAGPDTELAPVRTVPDPVVIPRSSEMAIERARSLFASGRLYDALRAIDLVRATDPLRADADKLKADIQRELLAHQTSPGGAELANPPSSSNPRTDVPANSANP
jgi:tetratricopeptide (TPR) repeat protein